MMFIVIAWGWEDNDFFLLHSEALELKMAPLIITSVCGVQFIQTEF